MSLVSNTDSGFNNTKEMVQINGPIPPLLYIIDETGEILDEGETVDSPKTIDLVDSEPEKMNTHFTPTRRNKKNKKIKKNKPKIAKGIKPKVIPGKTKRKFQKKKKSSLKTLKQKIDKIAIKEDPEVITIDDSASEASVILIDKDEKHSVIVINDTDDIGIGTVSGTIAKAANQNNNLNGQSIYFNEFENNNMATSTPLSSDKLTKQYNNNWQRKKLETAKLRPVILDGSNVAFGHGKDSFSSEGIQICVDYFRQRGHNVKVFLPQFRRTHPGTRDRHLLDILEKEGILVYTPSRKMDGKLVVSYDDRFIVEYADKVGGVIVSRDNFRDLLESDPRWKETICQRLLMYTFVDNLIMFPDDPLGRHGPNLDKFLRF